MSDRITVWVQASQVVKYNQNITFTREEWAAFKAAEEDELPRLIEDRIELSDVFDAEPIESFTARVIDPRTGKPVTPPDSLDF